MKPQVETKRNGFTLIELLLVLSVVAILSVLILPTMTKTIRTVQTNHFFKLMESDILLVQNRSLEQTGDNIRIIFKEDHYQIIEFTGTMKKQSYPKNISFKHGGHPIYFSNSGTTKSAGNFKLVNDHTNEQYIVIFPLGKGRHYIETK